jgi:hypothetical protein
MVVPTSEAVTVNEQPEDVQVGIEMVEILCKFCRRIQMEVSDDAVVTAIRWRCKSCKNWNSFELSPQPPECGRGKLKIKFIPMGGRDRQSARQ